MPLFFNNMPNKYRNNNRFLNNQNNNLPKDITLKPLTQEEMEKINQEIKENIEKNKKNVFNIQKPKNVDKVCKYVEDFIQDELNASIFYNELSKKCENKIYRNKLQNIYEECILECNNLKAYYEDIKNEKFEPKCIDINVNIPFKNGLFFAIEEEIKNYDKLCKIIEELPSQDTRIFYKMALKKLSRINNIQYMNMTINQKY